MSADFIGELESRGLLHQSSDPKLRERMLREPYRAYIGFDPTAASLHVGSLLQILALVRLQRAGHRPIAVVGGGTGMIGDPSGKVSERSMLTKEQIEENVLGIRSQLERFLDFSGSNGAILVNNADWLCQINMIDFLRDVGKCFSVNQMIVRDSVRLRLENRDQGISYTEFSYALLQAFDFLELYDRFGCRLQLGGSDQWGNIVDGIDLIRRMRNGRSYGVTQPLVTRADGSKFGKTESGNLWLDAKLTRPFDFYQFWLNSDDSDVIRHLRFFTFLSLDEIAALEIETTLAPERREAQRRLADEVTRLVHGDAVLAKIKRAASVLFDGGDLSTLALEDLSEALAGAPRIVLTSSMLGTEDSTLVSLAVAAGFAPSRSRARQMIESGGLTINHNVVSDPSQTLTTTDLVAGGIALLRRGRKNYCVIEVIER